MPRSRGCSPERRVAVARPTLLSPTAPWSPVLSATTKRVALFVGAMAAALVASAAPRAAAQTSNLQLAAIGACVEYAASYRTGVLPIPGIRELCEAARDGTCETTNGFIDVVPSNRLKLRPPPLYCGHPPPAGITQTRISLRAEDQVRVEEIDGALPADACAQYIRLVEHGVPVPIYMNPYCGTSSEDLCTATNKTLEREPNGALYSTIDCSSPFRRLGDIGGPATDQNTLKAACTALTMYREAESTDREYLNYLGRLCEMGN